MSICYFPRLEYDCCFWLAAFKGDYEHLFLCEGSKRSCYDSVVRMVVVVVAMTFCMVIATIVIVVVIVIAS